VDKAAFNYARATPFNIQAGWAMFLVMFKNHFLGCPRFVGCGAQPLSYE